MNPQDVVTSLIMAAAQFSGEPPQGIMGRRRHWALCQCRYAIWHELRAKGWTLQRIGAAFRRDHGTIINGLLRVRELKGKGETDFAHLCEFVHQAGNRLRNVEKES